jgi:amino acid adenylation domain-containing protein
VVAVSAERDGEAELAPQSADLRHVPCSQAQKRFWFEEQLHPGNPGLNVAVRWRLDGTVVHEHLVAAWSHLLSRHETLRSSFESVDGEPDQVVHAEVTLEVPIVDLRHVALDRVDAEIDRLASLEAHVPFDLSHAPLIRVTHVVVSDSQSVVFVTAHHAICDGWSMGVLAREMGELCATFASGASPALPPLTAAYSDYATWERDWLRSANLDAERAILKERLAQYRQFEIMPDHPRPPIQTANGDIVSRLLDRSLTSAVAGLASRSGCTLFMTAFAALVALLHRHGGEDDITVGTQVAGRDDLEFESIVGPFINTVALRADLRGDPDFSSLLERARTVVSDAFELRHVPLEQVIEIVNPKRDLSRNALFSVNFIFQRSFIANAAYPTFSLVDMASRSAGSIYDLNFFMVERPDGWRLSCEYNVDLFERATVTAILERFERVLATVARDPAIRLSQIPILSDAEHEAMRAANQTHAPFPRDRTVIDLFQDRVRAAPDAPALTCNGRSLSYAQLDEQSDHIARRLIENGCGSGMRVAILLERSVDLVVAVVGVLKAGCAYVPLDPTYPRERIAYILGHSKASCAIVREPAAVDVIVPGLAFLPFDDTESARPAGVLDAIQGGEAPAYVIYTSGSTGTPKGVEVPHRALMNLLCSMRAAPGLDASDTLLSVTTIAFDIAGLEVFLPLVTGANVIIATEAQASDGAELLRTLVACGATVMQATPSTWQMLIDAGWTGSPRLRVLCGGEALAPTLASRLLERSGEVWNMYGPTETTIWSCAVRLESSEVPVPIGGPISNTQLHVLDRNGVPVPPRVPGELYIGGDGLALGYLFAPDRTAERFVEIPVDGRMQRLYRTGDVVRLTGPGRFEFLGRTDHQVKIRGFRIELGEIEAALRLHSGVRDAVVVLGSTAAGDPSIWAYVSAAQPNADATFAAALREHLANKLPRHMLPGAIVPLRELPRTPNGKIDRAALAAPQTAPAGAAAPVTALEKQLAGFVCDLLGLESIDANADIFAAGFHSLLAVRLVARIREATGVPLPLRALFDAPSVCGLARSIESRQRIVAGAEDGAGPFAVLNAAGAKPAFLFFHSDVFAGGLYCRRLSAALGQEQPFIAAAPHGTAGLPLLPTIEAMALDYLPRIRAAQPRGPYRIGGFCVSGLVAYEVARLLEGQGETVERLVLVNASALPTRSIGLFDAAIRRLGSNARIDHAIRERLIYNIARLHAAAVAGIGPLGEFVRSRVVRRAIGRREEGVQIDEPQPFEKRKGTVETENALAHLTAALTYHPKPYRGELTLIWGTGQRAQEDPTVGWGALARRVDVVPMAGGHVAPLNEQIEELASALQSTLAG